MNGTCSGLVASLSPLEGGRFETQPGLSIITLNPIMDLHQWAMPVQSAGDYIKTIRCAFEQDPYKLLLLFADLYQL